MMVFAIHQHESTISIHMSPPSWTPSHLPAHTTPWGCHRAGALGSLLHTLNLPLAIHFTYGYVCVSVLFSQIVPPFSSLTVFKSLFFMSVSPLLPHKYDYQYRLSRFHRQALILDICLSLTYFIPYNKLKASYFFFSME